MRLKYLLPAFLLGLAALAALVWLVFNRAPDGIGLAGALVLLVIALSGLLAPLLAFIHRHIPLSRRPQDDLAALRQAFWLGLAAALIVFLQWRGLMDSTLALGIGVLVLLLEIFAQSGQAKP